MTKLTTIKVPTTEGVIDASGYVAFLIVAKRRVKCFLQIDHEGKPDKIAHFASGYLFPRASIRQHLGLLYASNPYAKLPRMTGAAQGALNRALGAIDDAKVIEKLDAAPVINR